MSARIDRMPLRASDVAVVRGLIQTNPGISLNRLAHLVAARCKAPGLGYATLRVFMKRHGISLPPVKLKGTAKKRITLFSAASGLEREQHGLFGVGMSGEAQVSSLHVAVAALNASVFSMGGLGSAVPVSAASSDHAAELRRNRMAALLDQRKRDAHRAATGWLTPRMLAGLAGAALNGALAHSRREPDPAEFDPQHPEAWFDPVCFAEDVSDLFRLAIFELACQAGIEAASHERDRLQSLGGAAFVLERLAPSMENSS